MLAVPIHVSTVHKHVWFSVTRMLKLQMNTMRQVITIPDLHDAHVFIWHLQLLSCLRTTKQWGTFIHPIAHIPFLFRFIS